MKKRNLLILSCFLLTTLVSCDGTEGDLPDLPVVADPDSPSYDGGLEGNEANLTMISTTKTTKILRFC